MSFVKKLKSKSFVYNSMLIILSGAFVKALGLLNKIFITRLLGTEGMSLYVMAFPTIILFISLSGFSLNITTSKLISESLASKKYSPKKIIKSSITLALKTSFFVEVFFVFSLTFLTNNLLKTPNLYSPLFMTTFLIPLVGITDTLRGVFAGYQKMTTVASVNIIEQIFRIIFSIGGIILFAKYGVVFSVSLTILALTIGEAASLIYLIIKLKKLKIDDYENTNNEKKAVWKMAFPTTLTRLIGSFTYFLEPIINTFILSHLGYSKTIIDYDYTIINAYIIPLITICIFLSTALSTTTIPVISEKNSENNSFEINTMIDKIFFFAIIPGVIISILLFIYPREFLNLLFSTSQGHVYIKVFVFLFLFYYIQSPGIAILQALGKAKLVLSICSFYNVFKLILIIILAYIPFIGTYSLFYAILVVTILETTTIWLRIHQISKYLPKKESLLNLIFVSFFVLSLGILTRLIVKSFIINSFFLIMTYLLLIYKFKIIKNLKIKSKKDLFH